MIGYPLWRALAFAAIGAGICIVFYLYRKGGG